MVLFCKVNLIVTSGTILSNSFSGPLVNSTKSTGLSNSKLSRGEQGIYVINEVIGKQSNLTIFTN
ncbi:hypothetical protein A2572_00690 [Candidatus Collierbacteria bacterium RIFOXYD1_FULL_40_9]|uniref:Uncharacterized protein n=1 Tax=Candidatus Collierbacteria bacterium RIFOXYD1_FULL_40_9 TaxID=1817731 RepID=A0A1F5FWN5_9BACT|nr:MAG: hypothetical protein A2572_00690 [Candidatus Collierbacteria bacterium RIFOXYD1_FULL_40_9]